MLDEDLNDEYDEYEEPFLQKHALSFLGIAWKIIVGVCIAAAIGVLILNRLEYNLKQELGQKAVFLMYDFSSADEIRENQKQLERIMSSEVFNGLKYDNENRQLYTYIKFNDSKSVVNVVKATDSYVLYRIESESIGADRLFIMLFEVNNGKISGVQECECLGFFENSDYLY